MPDISKRLERAERYIQKGKLDSAIEEYLVAWKEDPSNDAVVEIIADLYQRQNQPKNALECYGYLFDKHAERNDVPKALLVYRKMARLGPQEPARVLAFARFQERQKPDEALEAYRQAAQMFLERGDRSQALEALRGVAALSETDTEAHIQVGEAAESLGQKELAAQSFARAGELLRADNAPEKAMATLERAHALLPTDPKVSTALASALFEAGQPARVTELLEPFSGEALPERNRLLAQAHLATGNFKRAEDLLWAIAPNLPDVYNTLLRVVEGYLRARKPDGAVALLRRLKPAMFGIRKDREFINAVEALQQKNLAGAEVLEFLVALYNELNYDSLLSGVLSRLFKLHTEAGAWDKAASTLDRLVDLDPYDAENQNRLQQLGGKLDDKRHRAIAARFQQVAAATAPAEPGGERQVETAAEPQAAESGGGGGEDESSSLEDLVLQAEIFLQYGLKQRALERIQRIAKLFPGEEARNDKVRALFSSAGFTPRPAAGAAPAYRPDGGLAAAEAAAEEVVADVTRVADITRSIYRQGTVKTVLSTSVNEIGKTWKVSRCVAGLCSPGKPPSAVMEYCAPGMKQSDVISIVKLITSLVHLTTSGQPLPVEDVASSAKLGKLAQVAASLEIKSLLALPLVDTDQTIGVIVLEQCDHMRRWRANDIVVLKTLVEQMVIATSHVKLRSLMKTLAVADEHSGLLNRSSYLDCLISECVRAQKQSTPLSVVLLQFGRRPQKAREGGDEMLQKFMQEAAHTLIGHLRQNDIGVRYDSSTLALVLPDTKDKDTGFVVDKIRKVTSGIHIGDRDAPPLTAGIAEAIIQAKMDPVDSVTELINRLETALDAAQEEGAGASKVVTPPAELVATL